MELLDVSDFWESGNPDPMKSPRSYEEAKKNRSFI